MEGKREGSTSNLGIMFLQWTPSKKADRLETEASDEFILPGSTGSVQWINEWLHVTRTNSWLDMAGLHLNCAFIQWCDEWWWRMDMMMMTMTTMSMIISDKVSAHQPDNWAPYQIKPNAPVTPLTPTSLTESADSILTLSSWSDLREGTKLMAWILQSGLMSAPRHGASGQASCDRSGLTYPDTS